MADWTVKNEIEELKSRKNAIEIEIAQIDVEMEELMQAAIQ